VSIRVQSDATTQGVSHNWHAELGFGTLNLGRDGHMNHLYFYEAADIDAVIAGLTALRAKMTGEATPEPELHPHACKCGHYEAYHVGAVLLDPHPGQCTWDDDCDCQRYRAAAPAQATASVTA
jgi:hypothetical protein